MMTYTCGDHQSIGQYHDRYHVKGPDSGLTFSKTFFLVAIVALSGA